MTVVSELSNNKMLTLDELDGKSINKVTHNSADDASDRQNCSDIGHRIGRYRSAGN